jgi:hypothetical protein
LPNVDRTFDMQRIPRQGAWQLALEQTSDDHLDQHETIARYRMCYVAAVHMLADQAKQLKARDRTVAHQREEIRKLRAMPPEQIARAREEYSRLRDDYRRLRATILQADMGRAA